MPTWLTLTVGIILVVLLREEWPLVGNGVLVLLVLVLLMRILSRGGMSHASH